MKKPYRKFRKLPKSFAEKLSDIQFLMKVLPATKKIYDTAHSKLWVVEDAGRGLKYCLMTQREVVGAGKGMVNACSIRHSGGDLDGRAISAHDRKLIVEKIKSAE